MQLHFINVREREVKRFKIIHLLFIKKLFICSNVKIKNEFFLSLKISVLKRQFYDFFFYFTLIINSLINIQTNS